MKVSTMREINPKETTRAYAFELWMKAPMPMVTFFKILDVSRLVKISKKSGMKFNMLMCWNSITPAAILCTMLIIRL